MVFERLARENDAFYENVYTLCTERTNRPSKKKPNKKQTNKKPTTMPR
jgi:hypothetical protein